MTQEKIHKPTFDHEHWLKNMSDTRERVQTFIFEVWETFRILLDRGVTRVIKEIKFLISKSTILDFIGGGLSALIGFMAALILFAGFCLTGYQIILWLINGVWTEFPLFIVFNFLFENTALHSWVTNPESMYGLQVVVSWILENTPLSAALIIPGFILATTIAGVMALAVVIRYNQFKNQEKN